MTDETWRPIETAPKDGTRVLVWLCGEAHVAEYCAVWHPDNKRWCVREPANLRGEPSNVVKDISQVLIDGRPILGTHAGPTHWMPLPEPPQ